MPMHWRRLLDSVSFLLGLGVAAWMKYGLDSAWWAAIGVGLLVFIITPFIVSRALAKHLIRRMEQVAGTAREAMYPQTVLSDLRASQHLPSAAQSAIAAELPQV